MHRLLGNLGTLKSREASDERGSCSLEETADKGQRPFLSGDIHQHDLDSSQTSCFLKDNR